MKLIALFFGIVAGVALLSALSMRLWGGAPEKMEETRAIIMQPDMTVAEFADANRLPEEVVAQAFALASPQDAEKRLREFGRDDAQIVQRVQAAFVFYQEEHSKNWGKILLKFIAWGAFLLLMFRLTRKAAITDKNRLLFYGASALLFGVMLGADPNPMGTIKDAIALYALKGVIFPPRLIACAVLLTTVLLANKFICAWGCQFGALQDLLFRLNKGKIGLLKPYKPPFVVTNAIRIAVFIGFTGVAFLWSFDLLGHVDPFKIYNPAALTLTSGAFIGLLLLASLFVYRPWCHCFCPFGLAGWLVEKFSVFKIKVNYQTCTACNACAKACPSTVMEAILKQNRVIPDCFSCSSCINVCPTHSIRFDSGKREAPPEQKFAA